MKMSKIHMAKKNEKYPNFIKLKRQSDKLVMCYIQKEPNLYKKDQLKLSFSNDHDTYDSYQYT